MSVCEVKVSANIMPWWPRGEDGEPVSVNSICDRFKKTPLELNRYTLTKALRGELSKGDFDNLVKLAKIASELSGQDVSVIDLLHIEEDESND